MVHCGIWVWCIMELWNPVYLTHWGRVTHICVSNLTIIGSDNGLSPDRRQAIIWTNAGILLIGPPGTNFNEILIEIHTFSFKKIHLKMLSGKWRPSRHGLNVLNGWPSEDECGNTNRCIMCVDLRSCHHLVRIMRYADEKTFEVWTSKLGHVCVTYAYVYVPSPLIGWLFPQPCIKTGEWPRMVPWNTVETSRYIDLKCICLRRVCIQ